MAWIAFEILINIFQGYLALRYVRKCFTYPKKTPIADAALVLSITLFLNVYLFNPSTTMPSQLFFVFPVIHTLLFSSESKASIALWQLVLAIAFNTISILTYPIFDLLPVLLGFAFPSVKIGLFLRISFTNILLYFALELAIRLKRMSAFPRDSSYATFIPALASFYILEESVYLLYLSFQEEAVVLFLIIYMTLICCAGFSVFLFYSVSRDFERERRYQAEIAMLNQTRQHQEELMQMHEEMTQWRHDYKHHLQALQEMVGTSDHASAKEYLTALIEEKQEEAIITGSPSVDALLTAKRKVMNKNGIRFVYTPYPLSDLPISALDFCSILGNLLDNAIEGVLRIPDLHKREEDAIIHLTISRSWDMFYIYCENPCAPSSIRKRDDRFVSSKQDGQPNVHGVGLHSIETIAARADGRTAFTVSGQMFYAKVVLPFLSKAKSAAQA